MTHRSDQVARARKYSLACHEPPRRRVRARRLFIQKASSTYPLQVKEMYVIEHFEETLIVELQFAVPLRTELPELLFHDSRASQLIMGPLALICTTLTRHVLAISIMPSEKPRSIVGR